MRVKAWHCHQLNWKGKYSPILAHTQEWMPLRALCQRSPQSYDACPSLHYPQDTSERSWTIWTEAWLIHRGSKLLRNAGHSSNLTRFRNRSKNCKTFPEALCFVDSYDWKSCVSELMAKSCPWTWRRTSSYSALHKSELGTGWNQNQKQRPLTQLAA